MPQEFGPQVIAALRGDIVKLHSYNIIVFSSLEWAQGTDNAATLPAS
ncbi:hypothetical protein [Mesorhizobium sp.]|nr:hypothetical protein [Mesorhizobium sp.]